MKRQVRGRTRSILIHLKDHMSDCFQSFPTAAEVLIFAPQEHYQYHRSESTIIINESHFQATVLDVQSAYNLQRESKAQHHLPSGVSRLNMNKLVTVLFLQFGAHLADLFTSAVVL